MLMAIFFCELFGLIFPGFQAPSPKFTPKFTPKIHAQNCQHSSPVHFLEPHFLKPIFCLWGKTNNWARVSSKATLSLSGDWLYYCQQLRSSSSSSSSSSSTSTIWDVVVAIGLALSPLRIAGGHAGGVATRSHFEAIFWSYDLP